MALTSQAYQFEDATEAIEYFYRQGWTDGLPVMPPTEERVTAFLAGAGRAPDEVIGRNHVRRRTIRAEKVAINAVMAGCLPEYAPVVMAAVEAMTAEPFSLHGPAASLAGAAILCIVNGPVARALGFNSGTSLFGPGWRANATVGRAIRLILMNCLGAIPGVLDKSCFGHPGKFSYCIAEIEEGNPWPALHVDRGLAPEESAVTVCAAMGPVQVSGEYDTVEGLVDRLAEVIVALGRGVSGHWVVVISPEHQGHFLRAGWTKQQLREALYRKAAERHNALGAPAGRTLVLGGGDYGGTWEPIRTLDHLLLLTGGGGAGPMSVVIPPWGTGRSSTPVTVKVRR